MYVLQSLYDSNCPWFWVWLCIATSGSWVLLLVLQLVFSRYILLTHYGWDKMAAIFKGIFLNENAWIATRISMKFVPKVIIDIKPALVQIMAWRWPGGKPLSEAMMVSSVTWIGLNELKCNFCAPCEIALRWMPKKIFDVKSTLVQLLAWCNQIYDAIWHHKATMSSTEVSKTLLKVDPKLIISINGK